MYNLISSQNVLDIYLKSLNSNFFLKQEHEDEEHEVKKFDIIEENIPLPSVKKLAEFYASSTNLSDSNLKEPEVIYIN